MSEYGLPGMHFALGAAPSRRIGPARYWKKQLIVTTVPSLFEFDNTDRRRACGSPKTRLFLSGRPLATLIAFGVQFFKDQKADSKSQGKNRQLPN